MSEPTPTLMYQCPEHGQSPREDWGETWLPCCALATIVVLAPPPHHRMSDVTLIGPGTEGSLSYHYDATADDALTRMVMA